MTDAVANLTLTSVATGPSPALSGPSLTVASGTGGGFAATPFSASAWPSGQVPSASNTEIVRVTSVGGDALTIVRAQEGTAAQPIASGYQIAQTITAGLWAQLLPAALKYAGASTDVIQSAKLAADAFPRRSVRADGRESFNSPAAPVIWGAHTSPVGSGQDANYLFEGLVDTASIVKIQMPRVYLNDGTNFLHASYYPWTGSALSSTLNVVVDVGTMAAVASSGTMAVSSVFYGSGTIAYTGKTGTGASGTLTGCTIASGTLAQAFTDGSARWGLWMADSFGAPYLWVGDYGGIHVNDQYTFQYAGVSPSAAGDIIIGFDDPSNRSTGGSSIKFGNDGNVKIWRAADGYGNNEIQAVVDGHTLRFYSAGLFADTALNLGTTLSPWGSAFLTALLSGDGIVSAPAHSWKNEPGSGWYRNAAGDLRFAVLGVDALIVQASKIIVPTASAIDWGTDGYVAAGRTSDGLGNNEFYVTADTHTLIWGVAGLYPSTALHLGTSGNPWSNVYANSLCVGEGSNKKQGVSTLVGGTVVVANTSVTATSRIFLTAQSLGTVTAPSALCVSARTAGTSFTILASQATDTSVVGWEIFEVG
jgi:hypothetical protein